MVFMKRRSILRGLRNKEKLDEGGYEWSAKNLHAYSGIVMNEMYKKHLPDVPCMTKRQITKLLVKKT